MKRLQTYWIPISITLILIALLTIKGSITLDPDFGYRLRTGQMILSGNIPKTDPYTYTMPSFPYVEHALAIASFWALVFPRVGYTGIAFIHSLFALIALYISARRVGPTFDKLFPKNDIVFNKKLGILAWFPFLLAYLSVLPYFGVRAQVVSWVLLSGFLHLVLRSQFWDKYKFYTPLLFLAWANIHGSWSAALAILIALTIFRSIKARKVLFVDLVITILSFLATLINPYGTGVWREVWLSLSDSQIRWRISEWMPPFISVDFGFIFFFSISVFLVYKYRKQINSDSLLVYILVLSQALLSRRHVPLWVFVALPITMQTLGFLYKEIKSIQFGKERFYKIYTVSWVFSLAMLTLFSAVTIKKSTNLSERNFYPKDAIVYLQSHSPDGTIFSRYGWGGYLIWKYPEHKVFIDGRMPSWRWDAPEGELSAAFDDYTDMIQGDIDYKEIFETYSITTILISPAPDEEDESPALQKLQDWYQSLRESFGKESNDFDFYETLESDGWEIVYEDSVSVIYQKPE